MDFTLTNREREYLGLRKIENDWERLVLENITLYFEENRIVKFIRHTVNGYQENEMDLLTKDKNLILPKTKKGKPKKLTYASISSSNPVGQSFQFSNTYITFYNHTTKRNYLTSIIDNKTDTPLKDLRKWLDNYISNSSSEEISDIWNFVNSKKKNVKYKEGDFFAFKIDRRNYCFGRLLFDVKRFKKTDNFKVENNLGLSQLIATPLLVKAYHFISPNKNIPLSQLDNLKSFPSEFIMDNNLFYGDYEIIGNKPLMPEELEFPIQFGLSIPSGDGRKKYFQYGKIYKEVSKDSFQDSNHYDFTIKSIGFDIDLKKSIIIDCIKAKSNEHYWQAKHEFRNKDLRSPKYSTIKNAIFENLGLNPNKNYWENYQLTNRI